MIRTTYDAIVVGARVAGAPTAMLLARQGARVLLVDRSKFPSDTISGHAIRQPGVKYLRKWGLLDAVLQTGTPQIYDLSITIGDTVLLPPPDPDPVPLLAPRRTILDTLLVEAATKAGVEFIDGVSVSNLLKEGDQVYGIEGRTQGDRPLRARAPIVIGADGKHSVVAREVGAEFEVYQAPVSIAYYGYWNNASFDGIALMMGPGKAAGIFPTNNGQVLAFVQKRWSERHAFRSDPLQSYVAALLSFPKMDAALQDATLDGSLRGMIDLPSFFRRSYGPGWALVGDAAHHKDPIVARGMSDAFRDADLLSSAIGAGLGGEVDLLPALAKYQQVRMDMSRDLAVLNHRLAALPDSLEEAESRVTAVLGEEMRKEAELAVSTPLWHSAG